MADHYPQLYADLSPNQTTYRVQSYIHFLGGEWHTGETLFLQHLAQFKGRKEFVQSTGVEIHEPLLRMFTEWVHFTSGKYPSRIASRQMSDEEHKMLLRPVTMVVECIPHTFNDEGRSGGCSKFVAVD